ncbi:GA module-containing protein, partial [Mycoplasmopsis pullorum]|uniref:GA module-containing protein n=1 Tax=Mycoplasmopsis pullorum TaxID=48003 RepID=UPI00111B0953
MKNKKKIKKIVLAFSATSGSLPFLFLPISQSNITGSLREIDSKYMNYSQYNKVQDDGIYTNYNTIEGMFFEGWAVGNKKQPIYVGTNPNYSKNKSGYDKSRYYINDRNNWYRLYDYDTNKAKRNRYGENSYNPAWDLLNPSLVLSSDLINTRYNWQRNNNQDSSFFNGDGWDSVNDTKSFRIGFNVDKLRSDDRKFFVGLWISEDLILTGNIKAILSTRNSNGQFQEAIANPQNVKVYNISIDEKYDVNDIKGDRGDATWYGKEENKYRINPWISKSYDYTGDFRRGDNHSGFKFYSSNPNNEYAQFTRYYVQDEGRYTTGKTWLNSMHYGSFYKTFPKEINQNIVDQYGKLWGGVNNDYFRKRTIANMIIHDEPSLSGDWKYAPVAYNGAEYKLGLFQKQYKDKNDYIYNSLNNNAGSLLILEIKSEDESTAGFTPSLQLEFTVKRNPNTIDNNGVRSGNNASPLSRDASSKKTYIGFGQFKYESSGWADRQFGSFMKMADRQAYQNIKFNTTEKLVKSEYLFDNDKLPNTTLSLIENNNGSERLIHSVNKSKYNEVINQDKILAEYKTKNNVDSLTQYSNINNLKIKTSFVNSEDNKKWKIISENSYSVQNRNIFSFNTTDHDGYLNFNEISYDLTDYEKLKRFANDRTKNKWLTIKQINDLLSQIEQNENFNKTTYSFNNPKWFEDFKEKISNLNNLQGQAETKRAELRNLVLSTTDKTDWNSEISNKVLFAFADQREAKGPALKLLEIEGWSSNPSTAKKYDLQSELNLNSEAVDRNDDSKVTLQTESEVTKYISDVNDVITKIKQTGKNNLENEFINALNSQSITNKNWSNYNYIQGTKFIIDAINSALSRYNTPYDITTFVPANNIQYKNNKNTILNKIKTLSALYDEIQKIQPIIENIKNDNLVYGKTSSKPTLDNVWYTNFVTKLQNNNNVSSDSSYAFYSQNNLDTFKTQNASNLKNNWIDKILELNGNKNQFRTDINSFNYLDTSVKESFIQRIPTNKNFVYSESNYQLTDNRNTINNQLTTLIEEAFTQAKTKAKEKINGFSYVSQTLKNTALNNIDSAQLYKNKTDNAQDSWVYFGNDKNLKTIVDEIEKQNNYHKQLIDYLDSNTLNGKNNVLTQKQKEAFKNDILSKNFADQNEVNGYKNSINNVNDATQNLKTYVTNLNTNTDKYNFASPDKKRDFNAYKMVADSLVSGKSSVIDASKITKLQSDLTNAYNALDGDSFINKVKRLDYLTENLQNLIINQIKAADPNQRQAIYEKAKKLNDDFGTTDLTLINTYNSAKSNSDYTDGSKARKSAFDSALTSINAKLNASKNKLEQPTQVPTNYTNFIENYISQYDQLKSTIATAYNNLDGNEITAEKARLNAINLTFDYPSKKSTLPSRITESRITNDLPNNSNANVINTNFNKNDTDGTVGFNYQLVSTDSKFDYLPTDEKIKSDVKSATINGFLTLLEQKRREVLKYINDSSHLIQSEKTTLKSEANSANSIPALEAIHEKAKIWELSNTVKTEYSYLNNNQIQAVVDKIRAKTTLTEANTVFITAKNLNGAMRDLHDKVIEELKVLIPKNSLNDDQNKSPKTAIDYKLSDPNKQSAYDQALKNAQDLLNKTNGENKDQSQVNGILSALNTAYTALNGNENRSDLHSKIEQLSHLSVTQKQDLKDLVDAANSKTDAQTIYEKGKLLNDKIAEFKEKITDAERVKATEAYTEDTTTKQGTFDNALGNAKSELATLQSESLSSLNASAIETKANGVATKTTTLNNAIEALDGYRNKVKKSLDNWEYLTPQQVKDLQDKVDSKSKKPTDDEVIAILSEGLRLA